ncbi:MAG: DUF4190 domain-containing protein [Akkermansiaceae bacterium]
MNEWYYGKEGQQYGPVDEATLRARAATGEVGPNDLVWCEGMKSWQPFREVIGSPGAPPPLPPDSLIQDERDSGEVAPAIPNSPYAPPVASPDGAMYRPAPGLPSTNGTAIASLVCGILSLVFFCLCGGIFFGIPAVICGHIALGQVNAPDNQQDGRGLAIAGLVCGYCGLALFAVMMLQGEASFGVDEIINL